MELSPTRFINQQNNPQWTYDRKKTPQKHGASFYYAWIGEIERCWDDLNGALIWAKQYQIVAADEEIQQHTSYTKYCLCLLATDRCRWRMKSTSWKVDTWCPCCPACQSTTMSSQTKGKNQFQHGGSIDNVTCDITGLQKSHQAWTSCRHALYTA